MLLITAPTILRWSKQRGQKIIFLGGSIEMGLADRWQDKIVESLVGTNTVILNPRRDDWDSSWVQSITNKLFVEQVEWELSAIEQSDIVVVNFQPDTKSPISLLELGLISQRGCEVLVCCPEGFWRKGNVDIVCRRYGLHQINTLEGIIAYIKNTVWVEEKAFG